MSPFVLALALNLFFGGPACELEYELLPVGWAVLDDSGIEWPEPEQEEESNG